MTKKNGASKGRITHKALQLSTTQKRKMHAFMKPEEINPQQFFKAT